MQTICSKQLQYVYIQIQTLYNKNQTTSKPFRMIARKNGLMNEISNPEHDFSTIQFKQQENIPKRQINNRTHKGSKVHKKQAQSTNQQSTVLEPRKFLPQIIEKAQQFFNYFFHCQQSTVCARCDQTFSQQNLTKLFECNHLFCWLCAGILQAKFTSPSQYRCPVEGCDVIINHIDKEKSIKPQNLCKICQTSYKEEEISPFGNCGHLFCKNCLQSHIVSNIKSINLINCPQEGCKARIDEQGQTFKELTTDNQKKKYKKNEIQLRILSDPNLKACQQQTCDAVIDLRIWKSQMNQNSSLRIDCNNCKLEYCKQCFEKKHDGMCDQQMVQFLQRNQKYRKCSRCMRIVEKKEGCNHMKCLCGNHFCYLCGEYRDSQFGHECIAPNNLSYLQKVRWYMDHSDMFYETSVFSFRRFLYCFDRPEIVETAWRLIYSIIYGLTFYPISITLYLTLITLMIGFRTVKFMGWILISPALGLFLEYRFQIRFTYAIYRQCGLCALFVLQLFFYPFFVVAVLIAYIIEQRNSISPFDDLVRIFKESGSGLRNILCMPFVLFSKFNQ